MSSNQKKSNIFKRNSIRFFGSVFSEGSNNSSNNADKKSVKSRNSEKSVGSTPNRRLSMLSGNDTRSVKSTNTTKTSDSTKKSASEVDAKASPAQISTSVNQRNTVPQISSVNKIVAKSYNLTDITPEESFNYKRIPPDSVSVPAKSISDSTIRNVNDTTNVYASQGIKGKGIASQNIEISNTSPSENLIQRENVSNYSSGDKVLKSNHKGTKSEIEKLQEEVEDMILKSPYLEADGRDDLAVANSQGTPLDFSADVDSNGQYLTPIDTNKPILPLNISSENLAALRKLNEYAGNNDKDSLLFNEDNVDGSDESDFKDVDTYENLIKQQEKLRIANKSSSAFPTSHEAGNNSYNNSSAGTNNNSYPHFFDKNEKSEEEKIDHACVEGKNPNSEMQKLRQDSSKKIVTPETPNRDTDNWSIQDSPAYQKDNQFVSQDFKEQQNSQMTEAPLNSFKDDDDFVIQPSIHHIPTMKQDFNVSNNDFYEDEENFSHVKDTGNMIQSLVNKKTAYSSSLSDSQNIQSHSHPESYDFEASNGHPDQFAQSEAHNIRSPVYHDSEKSDDDNWDSPLEYGTAGLQIANPDSNEDDDVNHYSSPSGLRVINNESEDDSYSYSEIGNNGSSLQVVNNDESSEDESANSSDLQVARELNGRNDDVNSFASPPGILSENNNEFASGPYRRESIDLNSEINNTNDDYYSQVDSNILPQQRVISSRYSIADTLPSSYLATNQQDKSQALFSSQYNNNNNNNSSNKSENSSTSSRPMSSTNPFYHNYSLTDKSLNDSTSADNANNVYNNYNEATNAMSENDIDSSVHSSERNAVYSNNSSSIRTSKYVSSSIENNNFDSSESKKNPNDSFNAEIETNLSLGADSPKGSNEDKEKGKLKEVEMGKGIKSKYVETLRASTRLSNSQIGSRKWNLPLGIRTIDKRILERKSSQFSNSNQIKSLQKDIKHAALQLSMLAEEEEEEEEQEEEEASKIGVSLMENRRKSRFPVISGDRESEEADSSENDDVDLFADFAEDIEKVNKKVQSPNPNVDMDSIIGSPDAANLQRFQSIGTVNYGAPQPLFIANPDSD